MWRYKLLFLFLFIWKSATPILVNVYRNGFPWNSNSVIPAEVELSIYYESKCPDTAWFFDTILRPIMEKYSERVNVNMIPYGHAQTYETNGIYQFQCQHGEEECFGNKLHASAIFLLKNPILSTFFNICLMKYGSDIQAVLQCGALHNVDPNLIVQVAESDIGSMLLKTYGDMTLEHNFSYIPAIYLNGTPLNKEELPYLELRISIILQSSGF